MESLAVIGTGNAMVTKCYNTCFALCGDSEAVLVDAGGGNGIMAALKRMEISPLDIAHLIVTHEHCDHVMGVVWVVRQIGSMILSGKYTGSLRIYAHPKLCMTIRILCTRTLQKSITDLFGKRILFVEVSDGLCKRLGNRDFTFFNIHSTKAEQYGFTMRLLNGQKLTCLGDEPYNPVCERYVKGSAWLLCEAFCLYAQRDKYKPYEKHHSTVRQACELAESLKVDDLVLWHTEDDNYENRRELYSAEGKNYFSGNLFVPYDEEFIVLSD